MYFQRVLLASLLALAVAATTVSGLVCFCNKASDCVRRNASQSASLSSPVSSVCRVKEGGCCHQHLNKVPVVDREPGGDLRSDFYGCEDDIMLCLIHLTDSYRDVLYYACNDGDFCNLRENPNFPEGYPWHGEDEQGKDIINKATDEQSGGKRRLATALGVILGGVVLLVTIILVAVVCFKQTMRSRQHQRDTHKPSACVRTATLDSNDSRASLHPTSSSTSSPGTFTSSMLCSPVLPAGKTFDKQTVLEDPVATCVDLDGNLQFLRLSPSHHM